MAEIYRCRHVSMNVELTYLSLSLMAPRETASPARLGRTEARWCGGQQVGSLVAERAPGAISLEHGQEVNAMASTMNMISDRSQSSLSSLLSSAAAEPGIGAA